MESYNQMGKEDSSHRRGNFPAPVPYLTSSLIAPLNSSHHHMNMSMGQLTHLQSAPANADFFLSAAGKSKEAGGSHPPPRFHNYPLTVQTTLEEQQQQQERNNNYCTNINDSSNKSQVEAMKAKIIAHPQYSNLLQAYLDCQKVGAPPEVATRISALREEYEKRQPAGRNSTSKDPELDQFMEAYYDMLVKYREELAKPVQEAMEFMRTIESQLNLLSNGRARLNFTSDDRSDEGIGNSSKEDQENSEGETELPEIDPRAEDRELKNHLLKKYSGHLGSLKQELSKKKKKGKLPEEALHKLLSWWELHYNWPYPSESEKVALAESTGLDQKQINNWFINQRKRHWKPSEDMQLMVMEGIHSYPHPHPQSATLYMESHYMGAGVDAPYRFGT